MNSQITRKREDLNRKNELKAMADHTGINTKSQGISATRYTQINTKNQGINT